MKIGFLLICVAMVSACATNPDTGRKIDAPEISEELADELATLYFSKIPEYNHGSDVSISICNELQGDPQCDYLITHWGNGCGWGSYVTQECAADSCTFNMTPYDDKIICE